MSDDGRIVLVEASVGMTQGPKNTITVNGHDITGSVRGFRVECGVDKVTRVWLETMPGQTRTAVKAAVEDVIVE